MNARRHALPLCLVAVLAPACSKTETATEIIVIVNAEPGVLAQTEKLHVVVSGGSASATEHGAYNRTFSLPAGDLKWPHLTALAPSKGDTGRVYEFVASALNVDGNIVAQVRAVSGYVEHERLALRLLLEDSCVGKTCSSGLTCKKAECTSAKVDQAKLLPFTQADLKPATLDGGAATDGGARTLPPRHDGGMDGGAGDAGGRAGNSGGSGTGEGTGGVGGAGASGGSNGSADAGGSSACSGVNVCTAEYPCEELVCPPSSVQCQNLGAPPVDYTCRGQFADWTPTDSPTMFAVKSDGTVADLRSGLVWQRTIDTATYTWADAKTYCGSLALAGGGWRLPTEAELQSIIDFGRSYPAIDTTMFPTPTDNLGYWSSSPYLGGAGTAWSVNFNGGNSGSGSTLGSERVRCVR